MNKTLNILAILFLIACTNATKLISYSDIVTSLVELSDDREQAILHVNSITENFENSNNILTNLKTRVNADCENLTLRGAEHLKKLQAKIVSLKSSTALLTQENKQIADTVIDDEFSIKAEVERIRLAKQHMDSAKAEIANNEKAILESINVLKRLKNLAIDELQGAQQRQTEMGRFNVTITTPAFIQFADFHGQLKGLLSKTDSVNRGFISTLILLTQSAGKQTFSNPETVRKIVTMIDRVLANSYEKIGENQKSGQEKVKSYADMIANSRTLISRMKDEIARKVNVRASNEHEIVFFNSEVIFLERAVARREKRNAFSTQLCKQQSSLVDKHYKKYIETLNQVNELKTSLSSQ